MGLEKIKVLVIDDSAVVRETMSQILNSDPEIEVIGTASDPVFAVNKIQSNRPDVITLDVEMPRMDGLSFLRKVNNLANPIPVVICSSKVEGGSDNALKAMEYGAAELILKPKMGTKVFLQESKIRICDAVKAAYRSKNKRNIAGGMQGSFLKEIQPKLTADAILEKGSPRMTLETTEKIVAVGASTGGTEALAVFLKMLPIDAPGMVVVQHMPEHFTKSFAARLDSICSVSVKEAEDNDSIVRGRVLIAPGNKHTLIKRSGARYYVEVKDGPLVSRHRPSVDVLFRSASRYAGKNAVGVIMTGMGDDGAKGMKEMHDMGSWTIAQDEASCVVYGMPCEAVKAGGVDESVPLKEIAAAVLKAIGHKN
ncbi:MAG: chemotaxis response regulator protein-glutamate methylesterase [Spirochaetaceae bacterium]|nr:chemotaxis response regulator protein-glutamate methylesterase [Spirochaetaceae bacterium]